MNVWIVSHAYVAAVNHDKLVALADLPDVDLTVLTVDRWPTAYGALTPPPPRGRYRVVSSGTVAAGHIGAYVYLGGWRELRRARPAIVHAEVEPWSLAALECALAARRGGLVLFTWENLAGPRRALSRAVERVVLRRAAFVIAGNQAARTRMLNLGVRPDRVAVLPQFGVDAARYASGDPRRLSAPFRVAPPRPRPVVGFVGRLVANKGVDLLVQALAGMPARLVVVGEGPERPRLEREAKAAGIEAWFAGPVADGDVPDHLAAMDLLVLPSRTMPGWAEQFGHVLIEAMAAGVPVIGSSSGAIPEVVGDAGVIVPEGDLAALRAEIVRALGDETLRKKVIESGRQRVAERFTHRTIALGQREIYRRLLG